MTLTPAVSYRVNSWLYIGAGLNLMYGMLDDQVAINNAGEARPDGQLKYDDQKWGYGANLGILVEPKPGTRFGLTYLSEVKLDFGSVPEFSGLGPALELALSKQPGLTGNMGLGMTVPQMVMFSAYHELNEKWAVMGNLGWQNWSRFGKVDVQINSSNPASLTVNSNYNDTWHVALGAQYRGLVRHGRFPPALPTTAPPSTTTSARSRSPWGRSGVSPWVPRLPSPRI